MAEASRVRNRLTAEEVIISPVEERDLVSIVCCSFLYMPRSS